MKKLLFSPFFDSSKTCSKIAASFHQNLHSCDSLLVWQFQSFFSDVSGKAAPHEKTRNKITRKPLPKILAYTITVPVLNMVLIPHLL
jgi:hypothetical protein